MFRPLETRRLVVDLSFAAVFFVVAVVVTASQDVLLAVPGFSFVSRYVVLLAAVLSAVFSVALGLRRLSPVLALAIAWVAAIAQMSLGMPPLVANLAILGILYAAAAYGSRLVFWLGLASSFVGAGAVTLYLIVPPLTRGGWSFQAAVEQYLSTGILLYVATALAFVLSWTIGALVRSTLRARSNRAAQVRAETETAAEQERVRIARDMHDVVAHSLAVVIAQADGARYAAAADPSAATAALSTISATARAALSDVRLLLTQLRHSQGDGPQPTLADLEALYAQVRAAGVDLHVEVDPTPAAEPPAALQLAVYRILQEALTNALRHGDGGAVGVRLSWFADRVYLAVRNRVRLPTAPVPVQPRLLADALAGDGPAADAERETGGQGVIGMRERAQLVGGTLTAHAEHGEFAVRATLPIGAAAAVAEPDDVDRLFGGAR